MNILFLLMLVPAFAAFDWQGHRGARGLIPENTIEGMKEALRWPVTTLELDVVISKDKKVVVSHEPWMNPVICRHPEGKSFREKEFNLYNMDYSEILRFDCGSLPHPRFPQQKKMSVGKPTLAALVLEIEAQLKKEKRTVLYNIEIKSNEEQEKGKFQPPVAGFSDLVVAEIRAHLPDSRFVIQSFDPRVLIHIHQKYPEITLSHLTEVAQSAEEVRKILGFIPPIFSPHHELLSRENIPAYHALNMRVIPWTINDKETMRRLIGMGVDGIITDYPNLIPEVDVKECPKGSNLFEGNCVKLPKNAVPSDKNPGWDCKFGFVQRRFRCDRVKVPAHAVLSPDGHNWVCKEKYERYRNRCRKK